MVEKHTPGPWWMAATGEATGAGFDIGSGDVVIGYAQDRDDALLMKSAPELLAALCSLVEVLDIDEHEERYEQARAAIVRARGGK
jgi:hypothetical protein